MAITKIKVKQLIEKSKNSALLAVEIYNKPRTAFRSSGFIVLMHIAWTSLFHAIFERNNTSGWDKNNNQKTVFYPPPLLFPPSPAAAKKHLQAHAAGVGVSVSIAAALLR